MMKNKIKKFHKTAKDYKARSLGITGGCLAAICLGVFIPLMNEISKENVMLNHEIEVLLNDDVQYSKDKKVDFKVDLLQYVEHDSKLSLY